MKFLVFIILPFTLSAQIIDTFPKGLSLELAVLNPTLIWYNDINVDSFEVEISTSILFNTGEELSYFGIVDTFINVTLPEENTYYWRVRAQNAAGYSSWTDSWQFSTGIPGTYPPFVENPIPDQITHENFSTYTVADLDTVFNDIDSPDLSYSAITDGNTTVSIAGTNLNLSSVQDILGTSQVIVTATDELESTAHDTFMVSINDYSYL